MKLEKFHYIEGKGNRMFLYGFILAVVLMILINLFFSQAKYLKTESIKIAQGTINYKPYDFKIMAMYQENDSGAYEEIEIMPTSGYVINEEKSYCTIDNINRDNNAVLNTNENGEHTIANLSKNDKCYLYFDIKNMIIQDILATKTISTRTDFSTTLTTDTTGTIYSAEDDYGTSYYFAGAPTDNWVKFAGFYWRIIRINGDGTLRMIYSGSVESGPTTVGEATQIGTSAFNLACDNNMYMGYMYTNEQVHGIGANSSIKGVLDTWYNSNLASYTNYIAFGSGATFCNDRQPSTSSSTLNGSGGTGTTQTYYAGYIRLITNKAPTLKCADSRDRFTTSIGLITGDEVSYAGGVYGVTTINSSFYLYTGHNYWTMTPRNLYDSIARVLIVYIGGDSTVTNTWGVRPVINLKADTIFADGGMGTADNPYVVK